MGASSLESGADRLPFRVRPPRRPGSSDVAADNRVILSDHDLAVIAKAVARARHDAFILLPAAVRARPR